MNARTPTSRAEAVAESNARLTAANAAVLLVVLAAEGSHSGNCSRPNVLIGMVSGQ
jgi:hypothetical protein